MIELKEVAKYYDGRAIFDDVSLNLEEGTVTTFVGHNGCGKTTLLRVISGLVKKDGGEIKYPKKYKFSYIPDKMPAFNMSAYNYLKHMLDIEGLGNNSAALDQMKILAEEFFVSNMLDKKMNQLSKGTLQKIGVIQALLTKTDVLLLDEPLSGQDADSQEVFIKKIKEVKQQGSIILLAAHEPDLIHSLSDNVYGIVDGKVILYADKPKTRYIIAAEKGENSQVLPKDNMDLKMYKKGKSLHSFSEDTGTDLEKKEKRLHSLSEDIGKDLQEKKENIQSFSKMQGKPKESIFETDEEMLYLEIKRLQKEGWHIREIYENNTYNKI